jgi:hypothetical protein
LVLRLGGSNNEEGDIRVDGKGASVRVGDQTVPLRRQERPTIIIGGNRTAKASKANHESLRVLRVESNGPASASRGRKTDKP